MFMKFEVGDIVIIGSTPISDYAGEIGYIVSVPNFSSGESTWYNVMIDPPESKFKEPFTQGVYEPDLIPAAGKTCPLPVYARCAACDKGLIKLDYLCDSCRT